MPASVALWQSLTTSLHDQPQPGSARVLLLAATRLTPPAGTTNPFADKGTGPNRLLANLTVTAMDKLATFMTSYFASPQGLQPAAAPASVGAHRRSTMNHP
eukprot:NODE_6902_length_599_cov_23.623636_g5909_i0.p1 GENE.NODE_6902_length_599_cov_23.623636_g5909_i0~~NODE_6902_length_599_cov_23.623636_g5909_i0.p1  ORF type:complete len:101 (-),score=0.02 NODE_6902_length_599_cov_23.623636_g5909_i0:141-443(-)